MKINNAGDVIRFKSTPRNYRPEWAGLKPYTIRVIPHDEAPENIYSLFAIDHIDITNTETSESFRRRVSFVQLFEVHPDSSVWIFSWQHPREVQQ